MNATSLHFADAHLQRIVTGIRHTFETMKEAETKLVNSLLTSAEDLEEDHHDACEDTGVVLSYVRGDGSIGRVDSSTSRAHEAGMNAVAAAIGVRYH